MRDGRILWTRSEYLDKGADFGHTLWADPARRHPSRAVVRQQHDELLHERPRGARHQRAVLHADLARRRPERARSGWWTGRGPFDADAVTNITPDVRPHYHMDWPTRRVLPRPGAGLAAITSS